MAKKVFKNPGKIVRDDNGKPILDKNGNYVYAPQSGAANVTMAPWEYLMALPENAVADAAFGLASKITSPVLRKALSSATGKIASKIKSIPVYKANPFAERLVDKNASFRVVGEDAYEDFLRSGVVRSGKGAPTDLGEGMISYRPTSFPSFQKGYADTSYAPEGMESFVFKTKVPTFSRGEKNPVTGNTIRGRHYAHRPIDMQTGEVITELPAKDVSVFSATPNWLTGYKQIKKDGGQLNINDMSNEYKSGGWIKNAVNPAHKGYCTPMTKSTCTPRRKAFAMTMKKHHGFHADGGELFGADGYQDHSFGMTQPDYACGGNMYFLGGVKPPTTMQGNVGNVAGSIGGMIPTNTKGGATASGALQGASLGMNFGPIGGIAGTLLGGAAGFIGQDAKMKRDEFEANANDMKQRNELLGIKAMGGALTRAQNDSIIQANKNIPSIRRILNPNPKDVYKWPNGTSSTHMYGSYGNMVIPSIQMESSNRPGANYLEYFPKPVDRAYQVGDTLRMKNPEQAENFAKNYKNSDAWDNYIKKMNIKANGGTLNSKKIVKDDSGKPILNKNGEFVYAPQSGRADLTPLSEDPIFNILSIGSGLIGGGAKSLASIPSKLSFAKGNGIWLPKTPRLSYGSVFKEAGIDAARILNPFFANGGYILPQGVPANLATEYAQGGMLTEFNNGGSHESNPQNGVPQGIAEDGKPNLVEEGETKYQDYIFSDRLKIDEKAVNDHNLPKSMINKTFADASKRIAKLHKERPNDPITRDTMKSKMNHLMQANDEIREYEQSSMMANGGHLYDGLSEKTGYLDLENPARLNEFLYPSPNKQIQPIAFNLNSGLNDIQRTAYDSKQPKLAMQSSNLMNSAILKQRALNAPISATGRKPQVDSEFSGLHQGLETDKLNTFANKMQSKGLSDKKKLDTGFFGDSKNLRYAPIAFDAIAATGLFGKSPKPEAYSPSLIKQQGSLSAPQINEESMRSKIDAAYQNQIRGLAGASGGSGAALRSGLTGLGNDYMSAVGQGFLGAETANNQAQMQADQYNLGTAGNVASQNAQMINQSEMYNNQLLNQNKALNYDNRMSYLGKGAEGLGDIGYEQRMMEIFPKTTGYTDMGDWAAAINAAKKNPNAKACGGRLKMLKRRK